MVEKHSHVWKLVPKAAGGFVGDCRCGAQKHFANPDREMSFFERRDQILTAAAEVKAAARKCDSLH